MDEINEVSLVRILPLALLASLCVGLGLFMSDVIGMLSTIVLTLIPQTSQGASGFISMPLIVMVMFLCALLPFVFLYLLKANHKVARQTEPWACGFKYNPTMQIGSNAFSGDIKKALSFLLRYEREIKIDDYFSKATYTHKTHDLFWEKLYAPIIDGVMVIADKIGIFQSGRTNVYAGYILIYLCLILIFGYYYL